jgi:hypothetical protein
MVTVSFDDGQHSSARRRRRAEAVAAFTVDDGPDRSA